MGKFFDGLLNKIAPADEETDFAADFQRENTNTYIPQDPRTVNTGATAVPTESAFQNQPSQRSAGTNVAGMGSAIEMKVVRPDRFDSVGEIADLLRAGNTVLLNLEDTNKETMRRLLDFINGVAYALDGELRRIANNTYVATPKNVVVDDVESVPAQTEASEEVF